MKRLFRVKQDRVRNKAWWVVADHFPAAQKVSVEKGMVNNPDQVRFVGDLTDEYLGLGFEGLKTLLRKRKNTVVEIETELGEQPVRKFVPVSEKK